MSWNYRIIKEEKISPAGEMVAGYTIREVYYDTGGRACATTLDPCYPCGDSKTELGKDLELMTRAFREPILDIDDIPDPDAVIVGGRRDKD